MNLKPQSQKLWLASTGVFKLMKNTEVQKKLQTVLSYCYKKKCYY